MNVSNLLIEVGARLETLRRVENRFKDRLAPEFCIFNHVRPDENSLSRCLADLLDPNGTHGQGDVFLESFLGMSDMPESMKNIMEQIRNSGYVRVTCEYLADGRRIDIVLDWEDGVIGFENKPWAKDQPNQLSDYANFLEKYKLGKLGKWWLLYLSNGEPSKESISDDERKVYDHHLVALSYKQLENWLRKSSKLANALNVRVFIEELTEFIRFGVNGDLDMAEQSEVVDAVMASAKKLEAAFTIQKSWRATTAKLMEKLYLKLSERMKKEEFSGEYPRLLELESALKDGVNEGGFSFDLCENPSFRLRFAFEKRDYRNFYWSIVHADGTGDDRDDPQWIEIREIMDKAFPPARGRTTPWSAWWIYAQDTDELVKCKLSDWETSPEPWIAIREDSRHLDSIINIVKRVYEAFSDKMYLLAHKAD